MKKLLKLLSLSVLIVLSLIGSAAALSGGMVRVGLFYSANALPSANLENKVGAGYRFGYYNGDQFQSLGYTSETQISMLKTETIYLKNELYYASNPGAPAAVIGAYHLQLAGSYPSYDAARAAANTHPTAFPAFISGQYVLRLGAYATKDEALRAQSSFGGSKVVGTSSSGINVTRTKTATILFQYDNPDGAVFVVNPNLDDIGKSVTWFKGYHYYGDFFYERIGGGNLTVSNYLSIDDYVKGVLPYEMSASWPLEALKAQAVCARNYTMTSSASKHKAQHFDVCNTTCCQVYQGSSKASSNSDRAVDETAGIIAYSQGKAAQTFYYSSNGGASEDSKNVWTSDLPYLKGVLDPYEGSVASRISNYHWSASFTGAQLASTLQAKGYACSTIVDMKVTQYTALGNVGTVVFTDQQGKSYSFNRERARTILGLRSMRYTVNGAGASVGAGTYYVDGAGQTLSGLDGLWSIGEDGTKTQLAKNPFAITAAGNEALQSSAGSSAPTNTTPGLFTIKGSGYGHHVGMSQWGAYAMASQGFGYQDILKFYFTGIDLY